MNLFLQRILSDLIMIFCVLNGWWYIALVVAIFSAWSFDYFFEVIIAGMIFDSLFGYLESIKLAGYYGTIISLSIFIMIELLKRFLRR